MKADSRVIRDISSWDLFTMCDSTGLFSMTKRKLMVITCLEILKWAGMRFSICSRIFPAHSHTQKVGNFWLSIEAKAFELFRPSDRNFHRVQSRPPCMSGVVSRRIHVHLHGCWTWNNGFIITSWTSLKKKRDRETLLFCTVCDICWRC